MATNPEVRVTQLAGPGIEGLDTDPPLYHFDLEPHQVDELLNNPEGFLKRIGLGAEQGIAPNGNVNVVTNFNQRWTGERWERREITADLAANKPKGCCYVSDDSVICHPH